MPSNNKPDFIEKQLEEATPELKVGSPEQSQLESYSEDALLAVQQEHAALRPVPGELFAPESAANEDVVSNAVIQNRDNRGFGKWFSSKNSTFLLTVSALVLVASQGVSLEQARQQVLTGIAFARGADKPGFVGAVHDLTYDYYWHNRSRDARHVTQQALSALSVAKQDKGHREAYLLAGLAYNQLNRDQPEKGKDTVDRLLTALENPKDEMPEQLPFDLAHVGRSLEDGDDYGRARKIFEKAAALFPEYRGDESADAIFHVGYDYNHLGEFAKAKDILQKLIDGKKLVPYDLPKAQRALGVAYEGLQDYKLAEKHLNKSIDSAVRRWGPVNSSVAFSKTALGRVKNAQGNHAEGERLAEQGFEFFDDRRDDHQDEYSETKLNLANIYRDNGKYAEARKLYDEMISEIKEGDYTGPDSKLVISASDLMRKTTGK